MFAMWWCPISKPSECGCRRPLRRPNAMDIGKVDDRKGHKGKEKSKSDGKGKDEVGAKESTARMAKGRAARIKTSRSVPSERVPSRKAR